MRAATTAVFPTRLDAGSVSDGWGGVPAARPGAADRRVAVRPPTGSCWAGSTRAAWLAVVTGCGKRMCATTLHVAVRVGWAGWTGSMRNGIGGGHIGRVHGKAATMPYNVRKGAQTSFGIWLADGTTASPMPLRATTLYAALRPSRAGMVGVGAGRRGWRWRGRRWSHRAGSREACNDALQREKGCAGIVCDGLAVGTTASPMPLCATTLYAAVRASRAGMVGVGAGRRGWRWRGRRWSHAGSREACNDAVQREKGCAGIVRDGFALGSTASPMPLHATTLYAAVRASRAGMVGVGAGRRGWRWRGRRWSHRAGSREACNDALQREKGCAGIVRDGFALGSTASPMPLHATTLYAAARVGCPGAVSRGPGRDGPLDTTLRTAPPKDATNNLVWFISGVSGRLYHGPARPAAPRARSPEATSRNHALQREDGRNGDAAWNWAAGARTGHASETERWRLAAGWLAWPAGCAA